MDRLIDIRELSVRFSLDGETVHAVNGIDYSIRRREILGVAGESGCGKTTASLALLGLLGTRWADVRGSLFFHEDGLLLDLAEPQQAEGLFRLVRGRRIALLPQEAITALDPLFRIGDQVVEAIGLRRPVARRDRRGRAMELLRAVRMPRPEETVDAYPHQLSGGMRQRALIAIALAGRPSLLLADEPTTGLDVVIQDQLIRLLLDLSVTAGVSMQWISHSLPVLGWVADRVLVMYAGRIVEEGPAPALLEGPLHPYTQGLLGALPSLDRPDRRLRPIGGSVPDATEVPVGCAFQPRCQHSDRRCGEAPPLLEAAASRRVACWRAGEPIPERREQ
jgi:peptide/nickel transport system ATP-binding protein